MAEEQINIEILLETARSAKSVEELEDSIKDLKNAATQVGATDKDFDKLTATAGKLKRRIEETEKAVDQTSKGFRGLQQFVNIGTGIAAGFSIAEGASALFGEENEDLAKSLQKVTGAMAILNGLQEIRTALIEDSAIATKAAAAAQSLYSTVVGTSTGALKAFRLALLATGIGAAVIAIGLLIANWDRLTDAIGLSNKALERRSQLLTSLQSLNATQQSIIEKRIELRKREGKGIEDLEEKQQELLKEQVKNTKSNYETQKKLLEDRLRDEIKDITTSATVAGNKVREITEEQNKDLLELDEKYLKEKLKLNDEEVKNFIDAQQKVLEEREKSIDAQIALEEKLEKERDRIRQRNTKSLSLFINSLARGQERYKNLLILDAEYYNKLTDIASRAIGLVEDDENKSYEERIDNLKNLLDTQKELYEKQQLEVEATFKELKFQELKDGLVGSLSTISSEVVGQMNVALRLTDEKLDELQTAVDSSLSGLFSGAIGKDIKDVNLDALQKRVASGLRTLAYEFTDGDKNKLGLLNKFLFGEDSELTNRFVRETITKFNRDITLIEEQYNLTLKELEKSNKDAFNAITDSAIQTSLALGELNVAEAEFQRTILGFEEGKVTMNEFNDEVRKARNEWDELGTIWKRVGDDDDTEADNFFKRFKRASDEGLTKTLENQAERRVELLKKEGQARIEVASENSLNELNLINKTADYRIEALEELIKKYPAMQDKVLKEIDKIDKERDKKVKIELKRSGEEFVDIQRDINEKIKDVYDKLSKEQKAYLVGIAKEFANQFGDTLISISSRIANERISNIERTRDAQIRALEEEEAAIIKKEQNLTNVEKARLAREEMYQTKKQQLEQKAAIETSRISNKQALLEWRLTLAETTAEAALAALKGLSTAGPIGFAAASALGALQIGAVIGSKPQMEIPQFASGGFVSGKGGPKDDMVPAMLSNGESVINAKSTRMFAPILDSINRAGGGSPIIPKFATGGFVSQTITQELDTSNLQQTIMMLGDRPIKTYVVSQDITNAQHNDNLLKNRTTF